MRMSPVDADMNRNNETVEDIRNRTETGQTNRTDKSSRLAKTHQDYWRGRLKQRSYLARSGERLEIPEWQVRMFHLGREQWFNLATPNQATAAVKARDIWISLQAVGWDGTLAKFKPNPILKAEVCTVGEFIAEVGKRSTLKPVTLFGYAQKFRQLVSSVAKIDSKLRVKARRRKYDYLTGGRKEWLAKVHAVRLDILDHDSIVAWRNARLAKVGADPRKRQSAERTCASILRCCKALFSADVLQALTVKVPAQNPFEKIKLGGPGHTRYRSTVNPAWLLACAERELLNLSGADLTAAFKAKQQYLALVLCLFGGLRRKEADCLAWRQVNLEEATLTVCATEHFQPKTPESERTVDLPAVAVDILRRFKKGCKSEFVLAGGDPNPAAMSPSYRANDTWEKLNGWLRSKGMPGPKCIHALRKESGSLVASEFGIEAARQHLGHRDIGTTSAHYVDKRKRVEVTLPLQTRLKSA